MIYRRIFSAPLIARAASSIIARATRAQIATEVRARPSSARFAGKPEDFAKLGIRRGRIEAFEDGMRTEGGLGGYEWWYFDSHPLAIATMWRPYRLILVPAVTNRTEGGRTRC